MNWKNYVKQIVASRPDITPKHGYNMNRRELFAQGYLATGSMIAMPSLLSLVSRKAQGAEDLCRAIQAENTNKTAVLIIDGAGGWQITGRNVIVGGEGGQSDALPVGSYSSIGLKAVAEPNGATNTNSEYGLLMQKDSYLLEGLNLGATALTRAKVDGRVYCVSSGDDSQTNPHNPAYWLRAAGADGTVVSLLGTDDRDFGGRALGPEGSMVAAYKPVRVNSSADAVGLVLPGILATVGGDKFVAAVMNATKTMSASQIKKFSSLSANEQFQIACAYSNANYQAQEFNAADVDPALDTILAGVYTNTNGAPANTSREAALVKLLLDGYAGVATLTVGGCDYHNNALANWSGKDREIGGIIGRALESARLKNKNLHVIVFTDGSTSCSGMGSNDDIRGFNGPTNDSGSRSSIFSLTYSKGVKTEMRDGKDRQAGYYNTTGAVQNAHAFSEAPAIAAELLLADYLALHEDDLTKVAQSVEKIAGKNTLGAKLADHIGYKKLA